MAGLAAGGLANPAAGPYMPPLFPDASQQLSPPGWGNFELMAHAQAQLLQSLPLATAALSVPVQPDPPARESCINSFQPALPVYPVSYTVHTNLSGVPRLPISRSANSDSPLNGTPLKGMYAIL